MKLLLLLKLFVLGVVCVLFLDEVEGNIVGMDVCRLRNNFNVEFFNVWKKIFLVKFVI